MPVDRGKAIELLKRIHLFRGIDEQRLESVLNLMEVVQLPAGTVIFSEGDAADYLYIIYTGRIHLSRYYQELRQDISLGYLEEGDTFGYEVLELNWPRQVNATVENEATLLRLSVQNIIAMLESLPIVGEKLQLILVSYRLMLHTRFSWLDPQEIIYYVARRHLFFLWIRILPPIVLAIILIPILLLSAVNAASALTSLILLCIITLGLFLWLLWAYVDWTNDYYLVTNRRVVFQEKIILLYDSRLESPIEAVQSTSISTSWLGRILGYGNVTIRTYIGTILFRDVTRPDLVMSLIQEQQTRSQVVQRRAELAAMEQVIERRISGMPPAPASAPKPAPPPPQPSGLQRFLSDLLHLRYEVGGTVLYRTHWFILLKKVGIPSLLLILIGIFFLSRLFNLFSLMSVPAVCGLNLLVGIPIFLWWLYQYIDWHNDVYLITPEQIVDVNKKPLGREERQAAPIKNILSIEYQRLGIIGLLLNFGTVYIRVGDQQLTFDNVLNPANVQRELFRALAAKTYQDRQAQAEAERQRMADWIATYHRVANRSRPPPSSPPTQSRF